MRAFSPIATFLSACLLSAAAVAQVPPPPKAAAKPPAIEVPSAVEAPAGPQLNRADLEAWLDGFIPYAIERGNIAGAVVVVVKDWFRYESHFVHGRDSLVDILKERGLLSESDAVQPLIGKKS